MAAPLALEDLFYISPESVMFKPAGGQYTFSRVENAHPDSRSALEVSLTAAVGPPIDKSLYQFSRCPKKLKCRLGILGVFPTPTTPDLISKGPRLTCKESKRRRERALSGATNFTGKITIDERRAAITLAKQERDLSSTGDQITLWTDGSFHSRDYRAGAAVVFQIPGTDKWQGKAFSLDNGICTGSGDAELFAMDAAVQIVWERFAFRQEEGESTQALSKVTIYSDSKGCLEQIRAWESHSIFETQFCEPLFARIMERVGTMKMFGVDTELRWIPARSAVSGNVAADRLAKEASRRSEPNPDLGYVSPTEGDPWVRQSY